MSVEKQRILVCGGRDQDPIKVKKWLDKSLNVDEIEVIIEGGARGADEGARYFAISHQVPLLTYNANWNEHGKSAGPIRNQKMLTEGKPDIVIAFEGGKGTDDMVRRARSKSGIVLFLVPHLT